MFPGQYSNHNQVARGITGGSSASDSTYYYRTFRSSGTLSVAKGQVDTSILIVGAGSGGQGGYGGSAGQAFISSKTFSKSKGNSTITIGAGGYSITLPTSTSISDSASTITASGAGYYISGNGFSNGSAVFADAGIDAYPGGGGASSKGANGVASWDPEYGYSSAVGGNGGFGISNPYFAATSTSSFVAGGGGGAAIDYAEGNVQRGFGLHGGGNGRSEGSNETSIPAQNGEANTGGGGGGASTSIGDGNSIGGSGIVIMRYLKNQAAG